MERISQQCQTKKPSLTLYHYSLLSRLMNSMNVIIFDIPRQKRHLVCVYQIGVCQCRGYDEIWNEVP
jgi:hypothetical protein